MEKPRTILFINSDPFGDGKARWEREYADMSEAIKRSKHRDDFDVKTCWAATTQSLRESMLEAESTIVHIAGKNDGKGIVFESSSGESVSVTPVALAGLMELFADKVELVVLSGCYNESQAIAISEVIPFVIGLDYRLPPATRIKSAVATYDAMAAGRDIHFAARLGQNTVSMENGDTSLIHLFENGRKIDLLPKKRSSLPSTYVPESVLSVEDNPHASLITPDKPAIPVPEVIFIKGGEFEMGSDDKLEEKPIHLVKLDDFYIGKYPVTFDEYDVFCKEVGFVKIKDQDWGRERFPVMNVNWDDARHYADWLSKKTGNIWRLPTEAQWEYAAGGGADNRTKYPGTNDEMDVGKYIWYIENSQRKTHKVGEGFPNSLGLYDMGGNVWEWCWDYYEEGYSSGKQINPTGPDKGNNRVLRGGGWGRGKEHCRVSARFNLPPKTRNTDLGFRVVRMP